MTTRNVLADPVQFDPSALESLLIEGFRRRGADFIIRAVDDAELLAATGMTEIPVPEMHPGLPTLDLAALAQQAPVAKAYAVSGLIPLGELTLFPGPGGVGKSLLALQIGAAMAAGLSAVLGMAVITGPVIYFALEDSQETVHFRLWHICRALGIDMAQLAGKLHIICRRDVLDNELGKFGHDGTFLPSETFNQLCNTIEATGAQLVLLDNVAHLFSGNENDRREVTRFCSLLAMMAHESGAAVCALAHPPKSEAKFSGNTAWENAGRVRVWMDWPDDLDRDKRVLSVEKSNYGPIGQVAEFRWHDWCFVRDEDLPPSVANQVRDVARQVAANEAFLACLAEVDAQGRNVSHSGSSNFAPKVFAKMPKGKGFTAAEFEAAMERLLHLGTIMADQDVGRYSNRSPKRGLKVAQSGAQSSAQAVHNDCSNGAQSKHNSAQAQPPSPTERDGGATDWPPPPPEELEWDDEGEVEP